MPPKKKFTEEQIVEAAFDIAKQEGLDSMTIRKVADRLGSSIAPIYVNFEDIEQLKRQVIGKIVELSRQLVAEQRSGNPFYDIGAASIRLANRYPALSRDMMMKPNRYMDDYERETTPWLISLMKQDPDLAGFDDGQLTLLLLKMKVFQLGLTVMTANGLLPQGMDEEAAIALLADTARDVMLAAEQRRKGGDGSR